MELSLVVGCGNFGVELSLDLCNHVAAPSKVVRSSVHMLSREIFPNSTLELACTLMAWLLLWLIDRVMLVLTWMVLGNVEKYGLKRLSMVPLELKSTQGKTPILDIGTLGKIKSGEIKIVPRIKLLSKCHVDLVDGTKAEVDSIILTTGYYSNVFPWVHV